MTQSPNDSMENRNATTVIQDEGVIHPVLTEAACLASPDQGWGNTDSAALEKISTIKYLFH